MVSFGLWIGYGMWVIDRYWSSSVVVVRYGAVGRNDEG